MSRFPLCLLSLIPFTAVLFSSCGGGSARPNQQPAAPQIVSITVTPVNPSVQLGTTQQFTATGTFSDGSTENLSSSVTWSSTSTAVATIDASGLATSKGQGTSTITATSGTISGSTVFTVTAPALVSLTVTIPATLFLGITQQATATGTFTDASQQDVTGIVVWTSGKPFVATIDAKGVITPTATGIDTVTASIGAVSASASFVDLATPRFIYASSRHSDGLSILAVDPLTSKLRNIAYKALGSGVFPMGVAAHPTKPWVYVLEGASKQVAALAVEANGSLNFISGGPFSTGDSATAITIDPAGRLLFITNAGSSNTVSAFSIDQNSGALSAVAGSPFPTGSAPSALIVHPSGKFLYVANRLANSVNAYSIDANTGALAAVGGALATGANPLSIACDPSGNYVFVGATLISAYSVSATTGALTPVPSSPFGIAGTIAESVAVDFTGKHLYAGDLVNQTIQEFSINSSTGALSPSTSSPLSTCNNPDSLAPDPSGKYLYVSCGGDSAVWAYHIDPNSGALTKSAQVAALDDLTGITITGGGAPLVFASTHAYVANATDQTISIFNIDPTQHTLATTGAAAVSGPTSAVIDWLGRFLYSANLMSSSITRDLVLTDGSLASPVSLSLSPPGEFPEFLAIDPSQRWLYVPENNGYLMVFNIDPTSGSLAPNVANSVNGQFQLNGNPVAAAVQPNGQAVYIANFSSNQIQAFDIDADTGALNPTVKQPFTAGTNPTALAIDPSGSFLYAANFGSNDVSAYSIFPGSNNLVPVSTTTFPAGSHPIALVVDSSGNFLYVANQGDGTISAFHIDAASGTLLALPNSPFAGVASASSMALDAGGHFLYVTSQSANLTGAYKINADGSLAFLANAATGAQPRAIVTNTVVQ